MVYEIKDAPWVGMDLDEYIERCSFYDENQDDYLDEQAEAAYKAARGEELSRRERHGEIVWKIYDYLTTRAIGETNAISSRHLSRHFAVSDRKLRDDINEIRTSPDFEKVIGSGNNGYYACATQEEVDRTNNALRSHALSELQVYWANERKAGRNGQGKIICGEDGKPFIESLARAE